MKRILPLSSFPLFLFSLAGCGETAEALRDLLPPARDMKGLNGNEKFIYLDVSLPSASEALGHVEAVGSGDVTVSFQ